MTAMAGLMGVENQNIYGIPQGQFVSSSQQRNCDKKKCKSCVYIHKDGSGRYHCEYKNYVSPMDVVCGNYKKRKK